MSLSNDLTLASFWFVEEKQLMATMLWVESEEVSTAW